MFVVYCVPGHGYVHGPSLYRRPGCKIPDRGTSQSRWSRKDPLIYGASPKDNSKMGQSSRRHSTLQNIIRILVRHLHKATLQCAWQFRILNLHQWRVELAYSESPTSRILSTQFTRASRAITCRTSYVYQICVAKWPSSSLPCCTYLWTLSTPSFINFDMDHARKRFAHRFVVLEKGVPSLRSAEVLGQGSAVQWAAGPCPSRPRLQSSLASRIAVAISPEALYFDPAVANHDILRQP